MKAANISGVIKSSMHNHSTMCDGINTMHEMAQAAYQSGFTDFGFSSHAESLYSKVPGISDEKFLEYKSEFEKLKSMYEGKMRLYLGIEQDYYSRVNFRDELDYTIGAVHDIYDEKTNSIYWVDGSKQVLQKCINEMFNGDAMKLVEHFYNLTAENAMNFKPDIIAHFDLIRKNITDNELFDENSTEYKELALNAMEKCIKSGAVFEINTGGMFRKYRDKPYPDDFILKELCQRKAPVTISADAHEIKAVNFYYDYALSLMKNIGFNYIYVYSNGNFEKKMI